MFTFSTQTIVDCGASHVAGGVFVGGGGKLRLEQFACEPLAVEPGREEEWPQAVAAALRALSARLRPIGPVTLVLPGHLVLTKFVKTPRVAAAKRARVIQFEAQQNIPYALSDVVWDHAVAGGSEHDLDVILCAAKLDAVDALCRAAESAGFVPRWLMPGVQALHGAIDVAVRDQPTLVADLGARYATLLLVENGRWHARTLSLGGHQVTQQLAESQDCDFAEAEVLKTSGRNAALLTGAMESFTARLSQELTRSVLHFKRQSDAAPPTRILLTGGAAQLPELAAALAARARVPVEQFSPLDGIEVAVAVGDSTAAHAPQLANLIGAARWHFTRAEAPLNLLPPRLRSRENQRRRQPWFAAAAVLAVAALLPPLLHFRQWETTLLRKTAALDAEIAPLRRRESLNRANREKLETLQRQVAVLHAAAARRANWPQLFADLQQRFHAVEDVWLDRMQLAPGADDSSVPLRLAISVRMLDRANPLAPTRDDASRKVGALLASLVDSPYIAAVEAERFDDGKPGILQFDCVLVAEPTHPL